MGARYLSGKSQSISYTDLNVAEAKQVSARGSLLLRVTTLLGLYFGSRKLMWFSTIAMFTVLVFQVGIGLRKRFEVQID